MDDDDHDMREGLAILQVLVMEKTPSTLEGAWSPLLQKVATNTEVSLAIADFLLLSLIHI